MVDKGLYLSYIKELELPEETSLIEYVYIKSDIASLSTKTRKLNFVPYEVTDVPPIAITENERTLVLQPIHLYKDPFRKGNHKLILCEVFDEEGLPADRDCRRFFEELLDAKNLHELRTCFGLHQQYAVLGTDKIQWNNPSEVKEKDFCNNHREKTCCCACSNDSCCRKRYRVQQSPETKASSPKKHTCHCVCICSPEESHCTKPRTQDREYCENCSPSPKSNVGNGEALPIKCPDIDVENTKTTTEPDLSAKQTCNKPEPYRPMRLGRDLFDAHLFACLYAGIYLSGGEQEDYGQWIFRIIEQEGSQSGDDLVMARYILIRLADQFRLHLTLRPNVTVVTLSTLCMRDADTPPIPFKVELSTDECIKTHSKFDPYTAMEVVAQAYNEITDYKQRNKAIFGYEVTELPLQEFTAPSDRKVEQNLSPKIAESSCIHKKSIVKSSMSSISRIPRITPPHKSVHVVE